MTARIRYIDRRNLRLWRILLCIDTKHWIVVCSPSILFLGLGMSYKVGHRGVLFFWIVYLNIIVRFKLLLLACKTRDWGPIFFEFLGVCRSVALNHVLLTAVRFEFTLQGRSLTPLGSTPRSICKCICPRVPRWGVALLQTLPWLIVVGSGTHRNFLSGDRHHLGVDSTSDWLLSIAAGWH